MKVDNILSLIRLEANYLFSLFLKILYVFLYLKRVFNLRVLDALLYFLICSLLVIPKTIAKE